MAVSDSWQMTLKEIEALRTKIASTPAESKGTEALVEVACQLIKLNHNIDNLTEAVHQVASSCQ